MSGFCRAHPRWVGSIRWSVRSLDRLTQGAQTADLPVEQPKRFELALNLDAATKPGLKIPLPVLIRANRVINGAGPARGTTHSRPRPGTLNRVTRRRTGNPTVRGVIVNGVARLHSPGRRGSWGDRVAGGCDPGWCRRHAAVGEDVVKRGQVDDDGDDASLGGALGTQEREHVVDARQRQRPGVAGSAPRGRFGGRPQQRNSRRRTHCRTWATAVAPGPVMLSNHHRNALGQRRKR